MKRLTVHLVWAAFALVLCAGYGQYVASRREAEVVDQQRRSSTRTRTLKARIDQLEDRLQEAGIEFEPVEEYPLEENPEAAASPPKENKPPSKKKEPPSDGEIIALIQSANRNDHKRALKEILKIKDDPARQARLFQVALASGDARLREYFVSQLDDLKSPEAIRLAAGLLLNDPSPRVRARTARELEQIGGPGAIAALHQAMGREGDFEVRRRVALALKDLGDETAVPQIIREMQPMMQNPDGDVRKELVETFGDLGTHESLGPLANALNDPNSDVRTSAIRGLGDTGLPEAIPLLAPLLDHTDGAVREEAVKAFGDFRTAAVLPHLERALSDPNREVRCEAVESLGQTRLPEALSLLRRMLNDPDERIVREAESSIRRIEEAR